MPKSRVPTISEGEYEALPAALQRKYFSSLERLRLAQDGSASPIKPQRHHRTRSTFAARKKSIFETFDNLPALPYFNPGLRPSSSRRTTYVAETLVNQDTAAWYASLPSTIRRKHFTKEERILFANERHHIILDAADGRRQRQKHPQDASDLFWLSQLHTWSSPEQSARQSIDSDWDIQVDQESDMMNSQQYLDSLTWLENNRELDLQLDDYHAAIQQTAQRQAATPALSGPKPSYRRNMSLSAVSIRRTSISSSPKSATRAPSLYFNRLQTPTSPRRPAFHHAAKSSLSIVDSNAAHYQDPAARMKLRVYLASPSKFDEALEFGFPSMADKRPKFPERPQTSPGLPKDLSRCRNSDDVPSLAADDASSHSDVDALSDPRTPNEPEFRSLRSKKSSVDRASIKPQIARSDQYAQSTTLDREMTIHMTLTRPDLRSPSSDTRPSSRHINAQPLEQAPLPPVKTTQSIWETLPAPTESKVKKLWRRMKLL